jgi:hypothetical protein
MSLHKLGAITQNTLIPLSLAIGLLGAAIWLGTLFARVQFLEAKDAPSRSEFNAMCTQLSDIKTGVDGINNYLRGKKLD